MTLQPTTTNSIPTTRLPTLLNDGDDDLDKILQDALDAMNIEDPATLPPTVTPATNSFTPHVSERSSVSNEKELQVMLEEAFKEMTNNSSIARTTTPGANRFIPPVSERLQVSHDEILQQQALTQAIVGKLIVFAKEYSTNPTGVRKQLQIEMYALKQMTSAMEEGKAPTEMIIPVQGGNSEMLKVFTDRLSEKDVSLLQESVISQLAMDESNKSSIFNKQQLLVNRLVQEKKAVYITEMPSSLLSDDEIVQRQEFMIQLGIEEDNSQKIIRHKDFELTANMGLIYVVSENQDIIPFIPQIISGSPNPSAGLEGFLELLKKFFPSDRVAALKQSYVSYLLKNLLT